MSTLRLQRTIPMEPPAICTGAAVDFRTWSRKSLYSCSKVTCSWPAVRACVAEISKQTAG
jgi:hypothetical protein